MPRFAPDPGEPRLVGTPRIRRARRVEHLDNPDVPANKVAFTRGPGTFHSREVLKGLGGRWEPDLLGGCWVLPADAADEAWAAIREAERTNPETGAAPTGPSPGFVRCYACGKKYTTVELSRLRHAVLADWYCGCADREKGPPPRTAQVRR